MPSVAEIMTPEVQTVTKFDTVGPIRDLMLDGKIHSAPVLDTDGTLVGIVTATDLVEEWEPMLGVSTVMSEDVVTIDPEATAVDAARLMLDRRFHHVVVVEGDQVIGVLSSFDLLRALAGEVEQKDRMIAARHHAEPGDRIVIRGQSIGRKERHGTIVEVRGPEGGPPFVVHWSDDPHAEPHDVLFFPSSDAAIAPPDDDS